jgi:D-proline reductase (dithiol) PrdB
MLPADLDLASASLAHDHYNHTAADHDRNAVYPLGRLRELAAAGEIGALTSVHLAFMGYQPDYVTLIERFMPPLVEATLAQRPDVVLLVPV